jgi:hypothetical protein
MPQPLDGLEDPVSCELMLATVSKKHDATFADRYGLTIQWKKWLCYY